MCIVFWPPQAALAMASPCNSSENSSSLASFLHLPLELLVRRVRNKREAELILEVANSASTFDSLLKTYETLAAASHSLQGAWDALWMAQESKVITAIPVIGREMSKLNWARGRLVQKMEEELQRMQKMGMALRHFVDVNLTVVEELKMEGVDRLAAEKLSLVEMERELEERIRSVFV